MCAEVTLLVSKPSRSPPLQRRSVVRRNSTNQGLERAQNLTRHIRVAKQQPMPLLAALLNRMFSPQVCCNLLVACVTLVQQLAALNTCVVCAIPDCRISNRHFTPTSLVLDGDCTAGRIA
jgi:hypothetical protein